MPDLFLTYFKRASGFARASAGARGACEDQPVQLPERPPDIVVTFRYGFPAFCQAGRGASHLVLFEQPFNELMIFRGL